MKFIDSDERKFARRKMAAAAKEMNQPDVGYWGETTGVTHFALISRTRDSGILETSNWDVVTADMLKRFPSSVKIENFSHWACGWLEVLTVQAYVKGLARERLTQATLAAFEWHQYINANGVADDDAYYAAENAALREYVADITPGKDFEWVEDRPENWVDLFLEAFDTGSNDYRDGDGIYIADRVATPILLQLGLIYDESQLGDDDSAPTYQPPVNNPAMYDRELF